MQIVQSIFVQFMHKVIVQIKKPFFATRKVITRYGFKSSPSLAFKSFILKDALQLTYFYCYIIDQLDFNGCYREITSPF